MQNRRKKSDEEIRRQVERTRGIYSRLGQPLAADMVIELYRHLGTAMEMAGGMAGDGRSMRATGKHSPRS